MALPSHDCRRLRAFRLESTLEPVVAAVLPVFGLVASGYLAGRLGLVTQASSTALNQFVYAFALPAMLFVAVYRGSLDEILGSGGFIAAVVLATMGTAAAGFALSYFLVGAPPAESTLRALNASFANTGYLGIPLVSLAYGERAALPAAWALELSSYQLETTWALEPDAAVLLNVTEDHLDRYSGIDEYAAAKARVFLGNGV